MIKKIMVFAVTCGFILTSSIVYAKERTVVDLGKKTSAPFSPAVIVDVEKLVFLSGQVGMDGSGKLPEGIEAQTKQALENVKTVLEAAGSSMDKAVKVSIFMTDINDYDTVNNIYKTYFTKDFPARTALQVAALPFGALIEIEVVAVK